MVISCIHEEAEVYTEKSCNFPSPFEVKLKHITACLYGQESDCVFWHLSARLVGNFPLNPLIAQIPVERTYISIAAGLPYGVCLCYLWLLHHSVYSSEAMPFHVLVFSYVQHTFKMKYWPKPSGWLSDLCMPHKYQCENIPPSPHRMHLTCFFWTTPALTQQGLQQRTTSSGQGRVLNWPL